MLKLYSRASALILIFAVPISPALSQDGFSTKCASVDSYISNVRKSIPGIWYYNGPTDERAQYNKIDQCTVTFDESINFKFEPEVDKISGALSGGFIFNRITKCGNRTFAVSVIGDAVINTKVTVGESGTYCQVVFDVLLSPREYEPPSLRQGAISIFGKNYLSDQYRIELQTEKLMLLKSSRKDRVLRKMT